MLEMYQLSISGKLYSATDVNAGDNAGDNVGDNVGDNRLNEIIALIKQNNQISAKLRRTFKSIINS